MNPVRNWNDLFSEMRRLYQNVSTLLLDVDRAMQLQGFEVAHGKPNQIGISRSGDIHAPAYWAPTWIARFYQMAGAPPLGPLAYVACVLSDDASHTYQLPPGGDPLLTFGVLRYHREGPLKYWFALSWLWFAKGRSTEDPWVNVSPQEWFTKYGLERVETGAIPLPKIESRAALETQVIEPLTHRFRAPQKGPTPAESINVFDLLQQLPSGTRSKDEIDRQLASDRGDW